jgi:hypothetical protein
MDLGTRHIRTAGKGSGSVEITLPIDLRDLVGLPCRITLRDGIRPDIVLQPDLQRAQAAFAVVWRHMATTLSRPCDALPDWQLAGFGFALRPQGGGGDLPLLCWRDGLKLAAPGPHDAGAVARTVAAFGRALAAELRISAALAAGFGAACGYLLAGAPPLPDGQEACDLAAAALRDSTQPGAPLDAAGDGPEGACGAAFWSAAQPVLAATSELFLNWSADPAGHATLRAAWRRGRSIQMSGG